ncbi:Relaxase OS=Rhodanobacter lindaniclasticus OX=75310 GN=B1991_11175 PE=4 SV=1 [Rhodanobacter lindaniclasticus]
MAWLRKGIASRRLIINDAKALVHSVSDTAYLVSPGVFQRYAQEHPQVSALAKQEEQSDWQWVQKRFERLQVHRKQPNGLNIWICDVVGPRKTRRLHGYLLTDPLQLFQNPPPNNPYLSLVQANRDQ